MSEWILQEAFQTLTIENNISLSSALLRILLAVLLSSIIGCERANKRHSAGLRTFILASFSACLAMILDLLFIMLFSLQWRTQYITYMCVALIRVCSPT